MLGDGRNGEDGGVVGIGETELEGTDAAMSPDILSLRFRVETFPVKRNSRNSRGKCLMCSSIILWKG